MLTSIYAAFFIGLVLTVTLWLLPKLARIILALVICLLPYGLVRGYQMIGNVRRALEDERRREHEAKVDRDMIDMS